MHQISHSIIIFMNNVPLVDWSLVVEGMECGGDSTWKGSQDNAGKCAGECRGISFMFSYSSLHKDCFCEIPATEDGTCGSAGLESARTYNLYKYLSADTTPDKGIFCI